jgi:hypothetical protein
MKTRFEHVLGDEVVNPLCESQSMYDYDRRVRLAAGSATPTWDKLFKDGDKVTSTLDKVAGRLNTLADKVEKAVKKAGFQTANPEVNELLGKCLDTARPAFDPFRPVLDKGKNELDEIKGEFEAVKQAKEVYTAFRALDKAYNAIGQARQDKDLEGADKLAHEIAMAVSTLKTIFGQYVRAYGH